MKSIHLLLSLAVMMISAFHPTQTCPQCHYIPSTSTSADTLSYVFSGGTFASYGCAPIDPTYWMSGYGNSVTVSFVYPEDNPGFRVWGMNDNDTATVTVNGLPYPMNYGSASYAPKVVCGSSPGPDGITFANGKIAGTNTANYSYQDVFVHASGVTSITIMGTAGLGWGFAGVIVDCQEILATRTQGDACLATVTPNPIAHTAIITLSDHLQYGVAELYDPAGRKVTTLGVFTGNRLEINRDKIPGGVYFLTVRENNSVRATARLIVLP